MDIGSVDEESYRTTRRTQVKYKFGWAGHRSNIKRTTDYIGWKCEQRIEWRWGTERELEWNSGNIWWSVQRSMGWRQWELLCNTTRKSVISREN